MKFIADFHIHSHFSIATSKNLVPEHLEYWARIKGIEVMGTGDCVHPGWLRELKEKLLPAGNGLYRLKNEYRLRESKELSHDNIPGEVHFMLTGEISSIYKKNGKTRKVHNICVFPDFGSLEQVQEKLDRIGNITSDGRPILGLDSRDLLEMVLETSELSFLIPAHIWTPWFSVLGSKSGFDSIKECYDDLTGHIFALETGLSSDPAMNRVCSFLDSYRLVSNSDAHSPEKLGREANLFDTEISYEAIYRSLKENRGFLGTIEFFPEEGKYHYDGHRKCGIRWDPLETIKHREICPVCGKSVTKGVMYRVAELADRRDISEADDLKDYYSITQMMDLLSEIMRKGPASKTVKNEYHRLIKDLGSEFHILLNAPEEDLRRAGGEHLALGINRLRKGRVIIEEGYDGEFGRIKVFNEEELAGVSGDTLFSGGEFNNEDENRDAVSVKFNISEFQEEYRTSALEISKESKTPPEGAADSPEQLLGIEHFTGPCMVIAGPGSGKTRILTRRALYLIKEKNISPQNILAITFSNRAALEMKSRISSGLGAKGQPGVMTFHAFGLSILTEHFDKLGRQEHFKIIDREEKAGLLRDIAGGKTRDAEKYTRLIERFKQGIHAEEDLGDIIDKYDNLLRDKNAFDLDDLIFLPVKLFEQCPDVLDKYRELCQWVLVDEYQDINAVQYRLVSMLAGPGEANLFVIGDPDQSIYAFRGSDVRFIDELKKDYPSVKIISLKKSYRCPGPVLRMAGQVLLREEHLLGRQDDMKVHIQQCETEKSEADWIAASIEKMMGGVRSFSIDSGISDGEPGSSGLGFSDFAVLCRTTHMFNPIIKAFHDHGIAYQVIGRAPFFRKEPCASALNLLGGAYYGRETSIEDYPQWTELRDMINTGTGLWDLLQFIIKDMNFPEEMITKLRKLSKSFGSDYDGFFRALSMRQGVDDYDERSEAVLLMTMHASKGLEFDTVFIAGCEQGIIPFELFGKKDRQEIEEEERLFYVAATRTVNRLFLTHAKSRSLSGRALVQRRSSFLDRIEKELIELHARASKGPADNEVQLDLFK